MKTREQIAEAITRQLVKEALQLVKEALAEVGLSEDSAIAAIGRATDNRVALQLGRDIAASGVSWLLVESGAAIMCLKCGAVSHNANDVKQRYCGSCHEFLDVEL